LSVRVRIPQPTATWASQNLERISTFFNVRPLKWLLAVVSYLQRSIFRRHKKRRKTNVEKKEWIIQIKIRIHFVKKENKGTNKLIK
jgi:hypothetical protein